MIKSAASGPHLGHDRYYEGIVNGRHCFVVGVGKRCDRALQIVAKDRREWLTTSAILAEFRRVHSHLYTTRDVRYALERLHGAGVMERRSTAYASEWRAIPGKKFRWKLQSVQGA